MCRILIIEDEVKIQEILTEFLREYGYETDSAYDGIEGLNIFKNNKYDLVLLDIMMPKIDGFATLELLRQESNVPVILLTALEEEEYQIKGFDLQADDYITKPFSINLVIRRIEAVLRRKNSPKSVQSENISGIKILSKNNVTLDTNACEVRISGKIIPVTYKEYELLKLLLENKNRVFTRDDLLRTIWGYDFIGDDKVVNNHIMRIRKKLGEDFIVTVRGIGYKIDE
ncbi:MAG: response regulator transcription factor [Oscillospiraceae bacterium]|jgi:two-component system response regulator VanR|nr:response regulator transcription factor [Oscillospiraceae bacterium]